MAIPGFFSPQPEDSKSQARRATQRFRDRMVALHRQAWAHYDRGRAVPSLGTHLTQHPTLQADEALSMHLTRHGKPITTTLTWLRDKHGNRTALAITRAADPEVFPNARNAAGGSQPGLIYLTRILSLPESNPKILWELEDLIAEYQACAENREFQRPVRGKRTDPSTTERITEHSEVDNPPSPD